jgi:hypothetical protein
MPLRIGPEYHDSNPKIAPCYRHIDDKGINVHSARMQIGKAGDYKHASPLDRDWSYFVASSARDFRIFSLRKRHPLWKDVVRIDISCAPVAGVVNYEGKGSPIPSGTMTERRGRLAAINRSLHWITSEAYFE